MDAAVDSDPHRTRAEREETAARHSCTPVALVRRRVTRAVIDTDHGAPGAPRPEIPGPPVRFGGVRTACASAPATSASNLREGSLVGNVRIAGANKPKAAPPAPLRAAA